MVSVKKYLIPVLLTVSALGGIARAFYAPDKIILILSLIATIGAVITSTRAWQKPKPKREIRKTINHNDWVRGNWESFLNPVFILENNIGKNVIVEIRKLGLGGHPKEYPWEFLPNSSDIIIKRPMEANIGEFQPIEIYLREV